MSFDLFVQGFRNGDARPLPLDAFNAVFARHIDRVRPEHGYHHLCAPDGGEADLYTTPDGDSIDGFMINHFSAGQVLDLVAQFARRADAVVMPVGCPTMLVDRQQAAHLPEELQEDVLIVTTGADIATAIATAD